MARDRCSKSARQKLEPIAKTLYELAQVEYLRLRGRQLEGKRHSIETPADFGRERRLTISQREAANGLGNAFNKQFNRGKGIPLDKAEKQLRKKHGFSR